MSIFPFIDGGDIEEQDESTELPIPREYAWDFVRNEFIVEDGKFKVVEGIEAIKIWVLKSIQCPRYRYLVYSWDYGHELEDLIGDIYSKKAMESEARRYVEEALLVNPYITEVTDVTTEGKRDKMSLSFTVQTIYGEVSVNV